LVGVDHRLCALVVAGKSDSEVAVSTASSAGLCGRRVVSKGSQRLSFGSLFSINLTNLEGKGERPSSPYFFKGESPLDKPFPWGLQKGG